MSVLVGEFGNNVPGVQEAGEEPEHAEENVDEGVGGAEAAFYPDWRVGVSGCDDG